VIWWLPPVVKWFSLRGAKPRWTRHYHVGHRAYIHQVWATDGKRYVELATRSETLTKEQEAEMLLLLG